MALLSSPLSSSPPFSIPIHAHIPSSSSAPSNCSAFSNLRVQLQCSASTNICTQTQQHQHQQPPPKIDTSLLTITESFYEDELWAAACLRVRSFNHFRPDTFGLQDHRNYLAEREFEALKERVSGKRLGFRRVSCINASLPMSHIISISDDLCSACKFPGDGEDRVVVGTLDLNQCLSLPDEIVGTKPEACVLSPRSLNLYGNKTDNSYVVAILYYVAPIKLFYWQVAGPDITRAYLSNVCVAEELHRNGLAYALLQMSKSVAQDWGITDLYVHVAVDNEPAKKLYIKSGFVHESDEPAWQARFLDRPRRLLLWTGLASI